MNKTLKLLSSLFLVSALATCITACGENESADEDVAPIVFNYTLEKNEADETDQYYILNSVTISEQAKTLIGKNDYTGLADLFNTAVEDYKPAMTYTKENVRTLTIPTEYDGKPVKKIGEDAIIDQLFITEIVVGDNIEEIGAGAFTGISALEKITLPFVGSTVNAYNDKKSFGYIFGTTSADGLTSCTQTYNEGTSSSASYYIPSGLKTVVITGSNSYSSETKYFEVGTDDDGNTTYTPTEETTGENIISIDEDTSKYSVPAYAFYGCTTIESVSLTGSLTAIEDYTFYGCTSLKSYSFADPITKVGANAFNGCTSLRTVDFNKVDDIGEYAFNGCTSLGKNYDNQLNAVEISATKFGKYAFSGCTSIDTLKFNANGANIGYGAFKGCTALREILFNGSGINIGKYAFSGCNTKLTQVDLTNVNTVDEGAFYGCSELKDVIGKNISDCGEKAFEKCNIPS